MPVTRLTCYLGIFFIPWAVLVMVGSSNAVNLTDGLDGLASGCMVFAGSAFAGLTYLAGHKVMAEYLQVPYIPGAGELSIVLGAAVGAVLGFLWFNCYPAQVFMGDTGSLPLGALLGFDCACDSPGSVADDCGRGLCGGDAQCDLTGFLVSTNGEPHPGLQPFAQSFFIQRPA